MKERIEEEKGKDNFAVAWLKLIYAGTHCSLSQSRLRSHLEFRVDVNMHVFRFVGAEHANSTQT